MTYVFGIDVGGTFTDAIVVDEKGTFRTYKVPSTPKDPSIASLNSIKEEAHLLGDARYLIHGTTHAENILIERKGAKVGMITTPGLRDRIYLQRTNQFWPYDYYYRKPLPLVQLESIREVPERIEADGNVLIPVDKEAVKRVSEELVAQGVEVIAVCFLNSWVNPINEREAEAAIREKNPNMIVSSSSEVLQEILEYERFAVTTVAAYLRPRMEKYITAMNLTLREMGLKGEFMIMQAGGGVMSAETASVKCPLILESGPAAGVIGTMFLSKTIGHDNVIAFDMGGTTAKTCLIHEGVPTISYENFKERFPVNLPMLATVSIGAGGGSIAWIDEQGGLHVGPQSAGADPGPACYGKGNKEPTVTDAHVILGRLAPSKFLGGKMQIYPELAKQAIDSVGEFYGMNSTEFASGLLEIVNSNMANLIRVVSVEKGYDPRDFVLVAYGGAGPLHAGRLARELDIPKVIIPPFPGIHCAYGMASADIKQDFVRGVVSPTAMVDIQRLNAVLAEMKVEAQETLRRDGISPENMIFIPSLDMRYVGQAYIPCTVEIGKDKVTKDKIETICKAFHKEHFRLYKWSAEEEPTELVNARLTAIGKTLKVPLKIAPPSEYNEKNTFERDVYFGDLKKSTRCKFYERASLPCGYSIEGPAIIYQMDSTTVVYPKQSATIDPNGLIVITLSE